MLEGCRVVAEAAGSMADAAGELDSVLQPRPRPRKWATLRRLLRHDFHAQNPRRPVAR